MARVAAIDDAGRRLVQDAVVAAEAGTDGEIVTIVARRSDSYGDAAEQYAFAGSLLVPTLVAIDPARVLGWLGNGWEAGETRLLVLAILIGEAALYLVLRWTLKWMPLRLALVPGSTKSRRVRRRAIDSFRVGAEARTGARVGILLYLSLDERRAEIVADRAIHQAVPAERWGEAMAALVTHVKAGRAAAGMAAAVAAIGAILAESFAKTATDVNELPDRLIEL